MTRDLSRIVGKSGVSQMAILLASLFPVLLAAEGFAAEVEIVRGQRALACVVLSPDAHQLEKEAADDLCWAVKEATGVALEVRQTPPAGDHLIPIRIGAAGLDQESAATKSTLADLPYDGVIVEANPDAILIAGPSPAGTANAVATVLLEDIGVRTYYPEPLFTIVPRAPSIKIRSRVDRPGFDYRIWSGLIGRDAAAYRRRNRLTDSRVPAKRWGFGHNLGNIIPVPTYGKEHPEYFAFRDGARRPEGEGVAHATQPCFTNPDVIRLTIEAAQRFFKEHPDRDTFSLCVNDNAKYCECEQCAAMDKPYRDLPVGRQYSESYFDYVSKVADAIAKSAPDRFLGVYAYWNVEQPPRNRKHLPDNVVVALTLDILQHYDPAYRKKDRELVNAWAGYAKYLHTYVYYGLGWYTPRTSPRLVAEDLSFAADNGVRAIYCESYPFWAWCGPMHYIAARLQWNPKADAGAILDEFHRDCFDTAADEMRAFHDACERYWTRPRSGRWFEGLDQLGPEEAMADTAILCEAQQHIKNALDKTRDAKARRRIKYLQRGFDFTMAVAQAFDTHKQAKTQPDALESLIAAANAVEKTHELLLAEPAYDHSYYKQGERFSRKCWGWFKPRIHAAAEARWKQLQAEMPEAEARAKWQALERESGLAAWLKKRNWDFGFTKPAGN